LDQQTIHIIQKKILKTLQYFRCDCYDIPYITKYKISELDPEFNEEKIWKIFNLDIEYGKFMK
jgi:hypothetical protein